MRKIVIAGFVFVCLLAGMVGLSACSPKAANAVSSTDPSQGDASKNVFIVTHIDVMPTFSASANQAIQKYAADSRKDQGAIRMEGLVQDGRSNHFTIVETWENRAAFEAHSGLAHTHQFRDTLQPMLGAPFDERLHEPIP
jgi:quinol monooxygenase YgiN